MSVLRFQLKISPHPCALDLKLVEIEEKNRVVGGVSAHRAVWS